MPIGKRVGSEYPGDHDHFPAPVPTTPPNPDSLSTTPTPPTPPTTPPKWYQINAAIISFIACGAIL